MVFVFYAGHAVLEKGTSHICLQDGLYPLEEMIRDFSENVNTAEYTFTVGVFDACRNISKSVHHINKIRGMDGQNYSQGDCNRILIFSCGPS